MVLRALSKVRIQFNAFDKRSASVREFLARCQSPLAVAENPKCEVLPKVRVDDQPPVVELTFLNGEVEVVNCSKLKVNDIVSIISKKNLQFESDDMMKEAGVKPPFLDMRK
mmetsp:Transcript_19278/g.42180  ORF Transcript_19278/g.42180 Transcript_19278/m.42180 type:complete len:111 (-) Transcript_19278:186-518(-)|eukprot:CAMPEP_0118933666 /NCGR_PEP_ID=MMETSP1169-20130426/12121_1 /TAXON_ID=36882 /ORGANISM="Pyramimonas obovata, Strain CCMP722" /LENGTH=110 /DNA_ID=CAMNT_0006876459 /DNA_START=88 /DNA_END=420 /DNA_ORIENTATION=-